MLISFELSMPGVSSWNGKWSGAAKTYAIVKSFRKPTFKLGYYTYDFGDGWRAGVTVREVDNATAWRLRKQSDGFCGYDWMVDSIIKDGDIYSVLRPKPLINPQPERRSARMKIRFKEYKEDARPPIGFWASGQYLCFCNVCKSGFLGDKRATHCADCAYKLAPMFFPKRSVDK